MEFQVWTHTSGLIDPFISLSRNPLDGGHVLLKVKTSCSRIAVKKVPTTCCRWFSNVFKDLFQTSADSNIRQ